MTTVSVGICPDKWRNSGTRLLIQERREKTGKDSCPKSLVLPLGDLLHRPHNYTKPSQKPAYRQLASVIIMDL